MDVQAKTDSDIRLETAIMDVKVKTEPDIKLETDVVEIEVRTEIHPEVKPQNTEIKKRELKTPQDPSESVIVKTRRRRLIVDDLTKIPVADMQAQLCDCSDIITNLELTSRTRWQKHWKERGGMDKVFAYPGYPILSNKLLKLFQRNLSTSSVENEDFTDSYKTLLCR